MTKIRYSKERLNHNLRMGLVFLVIGVILILLALITEDWNNSSFKSIGVGQLGAGILLLVIYYFENKWQYLTLKNGELTKNTILRKKIKLSEINSIREFAGDLKLITDKKEFVISTPIIEPNSLTELKKELKTLKVMWN